MMITANEIIDTMRSMENEEQRKILMGFFKTGKGQYGEGDNFLGLKVPQTRLVAKEAKGKVSLEEISKLLYCPWHEVRLCGFLLLVEEMKTALPGKRKGNTRQLAERREAITHFYLQHARQANNWDLVDLSCEYILGEYLLHPLADGSMPSRDILDKLAASDNLWEQRIAIVTTLQLIRHYQYADTLRIAGRFLSHPHDLIHKATGWALREMGKRDISILRDFLEQHVAEMPRTTLRYAIEKMEAAERKMWLGR